jgi:hypothetical protein
MSPHISLSAQKSMPCRIILISIITGYLTFSFKLTAELEFVKVKKDIGVWVLNVSLFVQYYCLMKNIPTVCKKYRIQTWDINTCEKRALPLGMQQDTSEFS